MEKIQYNVLEKVNTPDDLKKLSCDELKTLCDEIRAYIIDVLANNPGHLASGLGTVELSVALHYVFNTPDDKLVWDVGHQAYPHKILTGRKNLFHTIRTYKGISGFPKMEDIRLPLYRQHWVWPWHRDCRVTTPANILQL